MTDIGQKMDRCRAEHDGLERHAMMQIEQPAAAPASTQVGFDTDSARPTQRETAELMDQEQASAGPTLRCLWLMRQIPARLDAGDSVYSVRLVQAFARSGVEVAVFGLSERATEIGHAALANLSWHGVEGPQRSRTRSLFSMLPLEAARHATPKYKQELRDALRAHVFDVIVIDHYGLGWALEDTIRQGIGNPKIIYVAHNHEAALWRQLANDFKGNALKRAALLLNAVKIAYFEHRLVKRVDLVTAITAADAAALARTKTKRAPITLRPGYDGPRVATRHITEQTPRKAVILGSFRWVAKQLNLETFLKAADNLFAENTIMLDVIGDVPLEVRDRWEGRLRATRFRGFVDDIEGALADARIGIVAEGTGGGFKLKLLDYVFRRLPIAAIEGSLTGAEDLGPYVLSAANAEALAQGTVTLMDDIERLNEMHNGAFAVASHQFDWDRDGEQLRSSIEILHGSAVEKI
ncbi:MAG: glycosyltransferase [Alphaproteobacteria bacterium]